MSCALFNSYDTLNQMHIFSGLGYVFSSLSSTFSFNFQKKKMLLVLHLHDLLKCVIKHQ